jgi:hypothetical protein
MADESHLDVLQQGVEAWNSWRERNPSIEPDLSKADLLEANLSGANLLGADLSRANLLGAHLSEAYLSGANLSGANLSDATLTRSALVKTKLTGATLTGCRIYGISAWDLKLEGADQKNLIISPEGENTITVDDLEVAQFIYLLLKNEKLRNVIETMTSKAVLILGNFSKKRKAVLEEIREQLREHDNRYLPILFDFEIPKDQHFIDTVTTVARLARFVIADITQPKAVQDELREIVDKGVIMPIQPLISEPQRPYSAFKSLRMNRKWVLPPHSYKNPKDLVASFDEKVVAPAETMFKELEIERLRVLEEA